MPPSKWDLVLERKPIELAEHLVTELAALFAADLGRWPPEVEGAEVAELLARHPERPARQVLEEAFKLAEWDLERDVEAVDEYFRNHRYLAVELTQADREVLLFLSRLIVEQLLALGEATQGRFKRPRLLEVLRQTRAVYFST